MKLLLVAMEIGMAGMFFDKDEGSEEEQAKKLFLNSFTAN